MKYKAKDNEKEDTIYSEEENVKKRDKLEKINNNFKPNLSFYYLHNKFQIVKVIIRPYEKDLIM